MKKIIAILLSLTLMCSMSITGFAAEITDDSEMNTAQSEIVYTLDTGYCVYIPEQIDISNGAYTFEAGYINVSDTEQIVVRMSDIDEVSRIYLQNENNDELRCVVLYDNAVIAPDNVVAVFTDSITSDGVFQIEPQIYGNAHSTGRYSNIFEFSISVEPRI